MERIILENDIIINDTKNFNILLQNFNRSEEHTSELQSPTTLFPYTTLFRSPLYTNIKYL